MPELRTVRQAITCHSTDGVVVYRLRTTYARDVSKSVIVGKRKGREGIWGTLTSADVKESSL